MLVHVPERGNWAVEVASPDLLASEIVSLVEDRDPAVVLIATLAGVGDTLHLRYLCKRLRARFPDLPITLGWWGAEIDAAIRTQLLAAGADRLAVTIDETCAHLQELARLQRPLRAPALAGAAGRPPSAA
jgi:hypothetical protein